MTAKRKYEIPKSLYLTEVKTRLDTQKKRDVLLKFRLM